MKRRVTSMKQKLELSNKQLSVALIATREINILAQVNGHNLIQQEELLRIVAKATEAVRLHVVSSIKH